MKQILRSKRAFLYTMIALAIIAVVTIIIAAISGGLGIDSGLFDQGSCEPPCWQYLTPGLSSTDDVDDFLSNLSRIDWPTRNVYVPGAGCESFQLIDKFRLGGVDLYVVDGKLTFIQIIHPTKTTLGQIVDRYGDPEYFMAILYIGFDYYVYNLEIYYPQKGLAFVISTDAENDIGRNGTDIFENLSYQKQVVSKVEADMMVNSIQYFESGDLSSYYQSRYPCPVNQADAIDSVQSDIDNFIQEWSGFGKIDVIIDAELQNK